MTEIIVDSRLCCVVCGGEPTECEQLNSHEWIPCIGDCGGEVRPQWDKCPTCDSPIATVIEADSKSE